MSRASGVLRQWFDSSSPEYATISAELRALSDISVSPALPDISGPWAQLQLIRQSAPVPVIPAAAPVTVPAEESPASAQAPPEEAQEVTEQVDEADSEAETPGADDSE